MLRRACLTMVFALLVPAAARAAGPGLVATELRDAGPSYIFQGEYAGRVNGGYRPAPLGVQIIALADTRLAAVEYAGGLPGAGWDLGERRKAEGSFSGSLATLRGPDSRYVILRDKMWVYDGDDVLRGFVHKTERSSPTLGLLPPADAIVLFRGGESGELRSPKITADGLLMEGTETVRPVRDFFMHVEFRLPFMPAATGQGRGNSGVYIQGRYEVQVLDSFGLEGEPNECGGLYKLIRPRVNMCLPPLVWQTYEIDFRAARFDKAGKKTQPARLTVVHNGVPVHFNQEIPSKTGAGAAEGPDPRPIKFQDHNNPVRFRNVWLVER